MKRIAIFVGFTIYLILANNASAWWSVPALTSSTHHKISDDAMARMVNSEYPDMSIAP